MFSFLFAFSDIYLRHGSKEFCDVLESRTYSTSDTVHFYSVINLNPFMDCFLGHDNIDDHQGELEDC